MSRIMFNTVAHEWDTCLDTCQMYNRAQTISFTDPAGLEELGTWAVETVTDTVTGKMFQHSQNIWWMPFR